MGATVCCTLPYTACRRYSNSDGCDARQVRIYRNLENRLFACDGGVDALSEFAFLLLENASMIYPKIRELNLMVINIVKVSFDKLP